MNRELRKELILIIIIFILSSIISGYIIFTDLREYDLLLRELNFDAYFHFAFTNGFEFDSSKFQINLGKHAYITISRIEFLLFIFSMFTFLIFTIKQFFKKFENKLTNILFIIFNVFFSIAILVRLLEFLKWKHVFELQHFNQTQSNFESLKIECFLWFSLITLLGTLFYTINKIRKRN